MAPSRDGWTPHGGGRPTTPQGARRLGGKVAFFPFRINCLTRLSPLFGGCRRSGLRRTSRHPLDRDGGKRRYLGIEEADLLPVIYFLDELHCCFHSSRCNFRGSLGSGFGFWPKEQKPKPNPILLSGRKVNPRCRVRRQDAPVTQRSSRRRAHPSRRAARLRAELSDVRWLRLRPHTPSSAPLRAGLKSGWRTRDGARTAHAARLRAKSAVSSSRGTVRSLRCAAGTRLGHPTRRSRPLILFLAGLRGLPRPGSSSGFRLSARSASE